MPARQERPPPRYVQLIEHIFASRYTQGATVFEFEQTATGVAKSAERHYRLAPPEDVTSEDLDTYRRRPE